MIRKWLLALILCLPASQAPGDPAERALEAARSLESIGAEIAQAGTERNRIAGLARSIQAYEDGLFVLREGLRDAYLRELELSELFAARSAELTRILALLLATDRLDPNMALLHPSGALEATRAAQLMGDLAPSLAGTVSDLKQELDELRALRRARQYGLLALEQGLELAQDARVALSQAVSDRGPLPRHLLVDDEQLAQMARDAETLDEFAQALTQRGASLADRPVASFLAAHGTLDLPVRATVLRRFEQEDALGIARPGLVLAAAPGALVTAPWSATVRYAGALAGHGDVVILEPSEDVLLVLAGLGELLVQMGEIVPQGAPLGTMPQTQDGGMSTGTRSQTLYFEIRRGGIPIDPEPWFAFTGTTEPG